jgi:2-keto-4-pentenoate hydratase
VKAVQLRGGVLAAAATLVVGCAHAQCLSDTQAQALASHYAARTAAPDLPPMTDADARCSRAKLQALLLAHHGGVAGYKLGLTHPRIRQMLKGTDPVWGTLYAGMLTPAGAPVSVRFGARPTVEADLLVRVRSSAIHRATTPQEVLAALDQVVPYIELPDMLVANPLKLDANGMMAINMSARGGVTGTPLSVPDDAAARAAFYDALGTMRVTVKDGAGKVLSQETGADLMGHPMNAALWLVQALTREGVTLQPGQVLSLGSFPPVLVPKPGFTLQVSYEGLPGAQPVAVSFTD